jgi:ferritin-like metal-binding protein YciE
MPNMSPSTVFARELRKLYHAELEILDLHADLADAAVSDDVEELFSDHEADTVGQIHRIERIFDELGTDPRADGSPVMEGIIAVKDEIVAANQSPELRDLDVLSTGMMNERFEITVLDRLLLVASNLDLPTVVVTGLETNRREAKAALAEMGEIVERRRVE